MTYRDGYGSVSTTFSATVAAAGGTDLNNALVASGKECVLDAVLVDSTADTDAVTILVETVGGVKLHSFSGDLTATPPRRTGFSCGPHGIRSSDGLQFDITNNDTTQTTVALTFLTRVTGS